MNAFGAPPEIGILIYPGVQLATVHGLTDIFGIADGYARTHRAVDAATIRVTQWKFELGGEDIACVHDSVPGTPARPLFIIIPLTLLDWPPDAAMAAVADWLKEQYAGGAALGSVCSGAFLLAETGLLNGRIASTHWSCAAVLGERHPDIRVDSQIRIVDYGDIVTVGGFMAWIDLGIRLIGRFLGPTVAEETARFLLVRPEAAEASYFQGFAPNMVHGDGAVLRAQQLIHSRDGRDTSLTAIAERARLERRTLLRRFVKATGMSPMDYCRNVRIARARELLEFSNKTLKEMAWEVGYDDTRSFVRAFRKLVGVSPADYRRRFGSQAAA